MGGESMDEPLNCGELVNVADLYVRVAQPGEVSLAMANDGPGLVLIIDAEGEPVCFAIQGKEKLLVRLLNTYQPINEYTGERIVG